MKTIRLSPRVLVLIEDMHAEWRGLDFRLVGGNPDAEAIGPLAPNNPANEPAAVTGAAHDWAERRRSDAGKAHLGV